MGISRDRIGLTKQASRYRVGKKEPIESLDRRGRFRTPAKEAAPTRKKRFQETMEVGLFKTGGTA